MNKYLLQQNGSTETDVTMYNEKVVTAEIAKLRAKDLQSNLDVNDQLLHSQVHIAPNRNINIPTLLEVYCNLLEFLRIRNELILCASEVAVLERIY